MESNIDTIYIHRTLNGDTGAFNYLVQKYQKMVFTPALKILDNKEDAEDTAQEVFVKCNRALNRYIYCNISRGEAPYLKFVLQKTLRQFPMFLLFPIYLFLPEVPFLLYKPNHFFLVMF